MIKLNNGWDPECVNARLGGTQELTVAIDEIEMRGTQCKCALHKLLPHVCALALSGSCSTFVGNDPRGGTV